MEYLIAFLVAGAIGAAGQLILDNSKLTPAHLMVGLTVLGAVFTGLGLYKPFVEFAGAGATIPVSNFGYVLTQGVVSELRMLGWYGALAGVFELTGGAIAASIFFGFVFAVLFRPKG